MFTGKDHTTALVFLSYILTYTHCYNDKFSKENMGSFPRKFLMFVQLASSSSSLTSSKDPCR